MAFDQKVFQTGKTQTHEEQINDAMGRPRRFWSIKTPISYRDHAKALIGFSTDITEHQQAELALEESRVLMNAIVDSTDNLIWSVEAESFGLLNFNAGLGNYF